MATANANVAKTLAEFNKRTKTAYITTTWRSGRNWYRVWSDGFIEQAVYASSWTANSRTISLSKTMATTTYACCVMSLDNYGSQGYDGIRCQPASTSQVEINTVFGESRTCIIYVCGY